MKYEIEIPDAPVSAEPKYEQSSQGRALMELDKAKRALQDVFEAKKMLKIKEEHLRDRATTMQMIVDAEPKVSSGGMAQPVHGDN